MNRLFHLEKTIEKNIKDNQSYPNVEFVLINYNSGDNLDGYARKHLASYIEQGILKYYHTKEPEKFHASIAKNMAHNLASGDIVCNMDGDNFTGIDYAFYINYLFNQFDGKTIYQFTKAPFWGTVGRLCLSKQYFNALGGYDEDLLPIGHEDMDLINRAKALGLEHKTIEIENFLHYLSNTTVEKSINCTNTFEDYYSLEGKNRTKSNENIKKGLLKANPNGFKEQMVYANLETDPVKYTDLIKKLN